MAAWVAVGDEPSGKKTLPAQTQDESIGALLAARVKFAENGYRAVLEGLKETRRQGNVLVYVGQPERTYDWSLRWLEAEQDLAQDKAGRIAALDAHLKRMTEVEDKVKALTLDLLPKAAVWDAEWHRLDAQIMLARAKAK